MGVSGVCVGKYGDAMWCIEVQSALYGSSTVCAKLRPRVGI